LSSELGDIEMNAREGVFERGVEMDARALAAAKEAARLIYRKEYVGSMPQGGQTASVFPLRFVEQSDSDREWMRLSSQYANDTSMSSEHCTAGGVCETEDRTKHLSQPAPNRRHRRHHRHKTDHLRVERDFQSQAVPVSE